MRSTEPTLSLGGSQTRVAVTAEALFIGSASDCVGCEYDVGVPMDSFLLERELNDTLGELGGEGDGVNVLTLVSSGDIKCVCLSIVDESVASFIEISTSRLTAFGFIISLLMRFCC